MNVEDWLGKDNKLGIEIWNKKYRHGDESFDDWLKRVSGDSSVVKDLILQKKFLFGGRILANRGIEGKGYTLSNCYVLSPPEDSIESIFDTAGKLARTFSYGGGVGIDLSKLAPRGAKVNNSAGESTGSVSFTDLYSMVTGLIGQHGRRGALMLSLSCDHPDLEEFIGLKTDLNRVTKANVSVRVTDDFMKAVIDDDDYTLRFERAETGEVIERTVKAKDVFKRLCDANYDYAEPGVLFWDTIKRGSMVSVFPDFEFNGVNPCAEQPLPAGGSCLLGSINLAEFVVEKDGVPTFDENGFMDCVIMGVNALNDVLWEGMGLHPLAEQRDSVMKWRQIGLGIMGLGDMLIKLGIKYGSKEAIFLCDRIGGIMLATAYRQSVWLGENGVYPFIRNGRFFKSAIISRELAHEYGTGLVNSQLLTIAPTGSISTMLGISGGIEPIFAKSFTRRTTSLSNQDEYHVQHPKVIQDLMDKLGVDADHLPDYVVTASEIPWKERVDMQAVWQRHIDASISSTINLPSDFPKDSIMDIYIYAWKKGCKGVTIFRQDCKRDAILTTDKDYKEVESSTLIGKKRKLITGCGSLHCTAFFDSETGDLKEVFLNRGSDGGCMSYMNAMSRLASLSLRSGCTADEVINQLRSVSTCPSYAVRKATKEDTSKGSSCPMAVANALQEMCDEIKHKSLDESSEIVKNPCPKCGAELQFSGGCNTCPNCGWSKCD